MMTVDEAIKYAQNALERAFEDWLESERPSGDCESVHRQWDESFANQELVDELQPVLALTCEVRRLRDDAASTAGKIIKMTIEHDWALGEAKRIQAENERLRKDAERYQWLRVDASAYQAKTILNNTPAEIDSAIDAARSAK